MNIIGTAAAEFLGSLMAALMLAAGHSMRLRIKHRARRASTPVTSTRGTSAADSADTPNV